MSEAPQSGQILDGKYQVERVLGVGGMGAVVAAHHLQLDQKVAIKYLLPDALQIPEVVERFAREARAAAKIRGEHVARVIDVGKFTDGSPYMVMEYLEGNDLAKQLEKIGPLAVTDAIRYLLEACEALAEAHAAKIVHRDLKPSNLFLAQQPGKRSIIKVLDFGISKMDGNAQPSALTKTSALMGTAYYMSPEQLTSPKNVDARSDIWSLGVILYELLSARQPFQGDTMPEIIGGILANNPKPLREHRPDIPAELAQVVAQCMSTKQDNRPQSVAALAEMLAPFALPSDRGSVDIARQVLGGSMRPPSASYDSLPSVPTAPSAPGALTQQGLAASVSGAPRPRSSAGFIVAAVGLIIGVGGAVFFLRGKDAPPAAPAAAVTQPAATAPMPTQTAIAPAETIAPLPPPPAETPAAATPSDKTAPAAKTTTARPADKTTTTKSTTAKPAASAPPAQAAAPAPAPQPAPAPATPAAPKRSLEMGIK